MENKFKGFNQLTDETTNTHINAYLSEDKLLIVIGKSDGEWMLTPNSGNDTDFIDSFYSVFPKGNPTGDEKYIKDAITLYYGLQFFI